MLKKLKSINSKGYVNVSSNDRLHQHRFVLLPEC